MKKELLLRAFKVSSHWVFATLIISAALAIKSDPELMAHFTKGLIDFGIPVYVANLITAVGVKAIEINAAKIQK